MVDTIIGAAVKIRKSGNSNILTVPKEIKPKAQTYQVFQGRDGVIVYVPTHQNPFKDKNWVAAHHNMIQPEEIGGPLLGTELSD